MRIIECYSTLPINLVPNPWPDASNTGVPAGTVLTPTAGMTITVDNTVVDALDSTGSFFVHANNVTIKRCRITPNDYFGIDNEGFTGMLVQDCEFSTCGNSGILTGNNYIIERCNFHDCENGITLQSNGIIRDCYIHNLNNPAAPDPHYDGIQVDGSHIQILHNAVYGRDTSCVLILNDIGDIDDILVNNNLLIADEIPSDPCVGIYVYEKPQPGQITNVTCSNNVMTEGKSYFAIQDTTPTLINNRDFHTNALITG